MEEWDDSARREEALCYFASSIYQQIGAADEAVERARRLPAMRPRARCVTFCYIDQDGTSVGCVRLSVDWGAHRHYCRQHLPVPEDYQTAYESEATEILRLISDYFAHCHAKMYIAYEENDNSEPLDYEYLSMEDWYNSLNRKLTYTSRTLPELQLEIARE